jgi:ubiquinol-cytochrome c reductase cytochrome c1 subunit
MKKKTASLIFSLTAMLLAASPVFAAGGGTLESAGINVRDVAAIQRGAKWFVNYCFSCHSASYMRYNRLAEDLGLDEDLVQKNLIFADVKIGETMDIAMRPEDSESWLGKTPPDLSLISRSRGNDWLFTYMKTFYQDESGAWNNLVLPNVSMPHVFWQMQGIQKLSGSGHDDGHGSEQGAGQLVLATTGRMTPEQYEETVRDLVTFLDYLSEPAKLKRKNLGIWVMLFLLLFAGVAYALKVEYWRDVH